LLSYIEIENFNVEVLPRKCHVCIRHCIRTFLFDNKVYLQIVAQNERKFKQIVTMLDGSTEAGRIVERLTSGDSADVPSTEARTQTPRQNQNVDAVSSTPSSAILSRRAAMSSVGLAVDRARSMLNRDSVSAERSVLSSQQSRET
jgi:hypothetical protein